MMHDYMYIEAPSKHVQNLLKKIVQKFMLEKLRTKSPKKIVQSFMLENLRTKFTKKNRSEISARKVTYKIY